MTSIARIIQLAIIVYACHLATCSCLLQAKSEKLRRNFDNLAIWLERNIASEHWDKLFEGVNKNIRTDAARLKCRLFNYECGILRAADILSELNKVRQCDSRTLELLLSVSTGTYRAKSISRLHILVNEIAYNAIKTCPEYILEIHRDHKAPEVESLDRAVEVLKPYTFATSEFEATLNLPVDTWAKIIRLGGASDDKNVFGRTEERSTSIRWRGAVLKSNFNHIFRVYFQEPCKHYRGSWGDFLEAVDAIAYFNVMFSKMPLKPGYRFLKELPLELQDELNKFYICNSLDQRVVPLEAVVQQLASEDQKYNHVKLA